MEKLHPKRTKPNRQGSKLRSRVIDATKAFETVLKRGPRKPIEYILRLYVTGSSPRSLKAVHNLKRICEEYLPGQYDLEVIDIYQNPTAAREEQILAAPTLIKKLPAPLRRFVGDLSDTQKLLIGLGVYQPPEAND